MSDPNQPTPKDQSMKHAARIAATLAAAATLALTGCSSDAKVQSDDIAKDAATRGLIIDKRSRWALPARADAPWRLSVRPQSDEQRAPVPEEGSPPERTPQPATAAPAA